MRNLSPERKYVARYNSNCEAWALKILGGNSMGDFHCILKKKLNNNIIKKAWLCNQLLFMYKIELNSVLPNFNTGFSSDLVVLSTPHIAAKLHITADTLACFNAIRHRVNSQLSRQWKQEVAVWISFDLMVFLLLASTAIDRWRRISCWPWPALEETPKSGWTCFFKFLLQISKCLSSLILAFQSRQQLYALAPIYFNVENKQ